jgi:hypothetical protein
MQRRNTVVIFFVNGIGDTLLCLPALRALAKTFYRRVVLICLGGFPADVYRPLPLDRLITIDPAQLCGPQQRDFPVSDLARDVGLCDTFIALVPWKSHSLVQLAQHCAPRLSVGYFKGYDVAIPRVYTKHQIELAFDCVHYFQPNENLAAFLQVPVYSPVATSAADALRSLLPPGSRLLVVHADTKTEKMWPAERFRILLDTFLEAHPEFWVFVVGATDVGIDRCKHEDRIVPCYGLPLGASVCLTAQADVFLGVDSCMLHAADFARVPSVALFGPTVAAEFGCFICPNITVQAEGQMLDIDVEVVHSAVESLLSDPGQATLWRATTRDSVREKVTRRTDPSTTGPPRALEVFVDLETS